MSIRSSSEGSNPPRQPGGLKGDIHRLKTSGAEAAAELSAFVAKMKGRSPQEVLGEIAQSGLTKGVIAATVWSVIGMAVLTIGPYGMNKAFPPAAKPLAADAKAESKEAPAAEQPAKGDAGAVAKGSNPNDPDGKLLKKLNMDETKMADPKVNPLDDLGNSLLKDLK
jgi:hypothetical protein